MTPCMSSSTQDTERLWTPPPQEVEQAVQGLLSQLRSKRTKKRLAERVDREEVHRGHWIGDIPGQRVVQVVRHDLLVAVAGGQRNGKI